MAEYIDREELYNVEKLLDTDIVRRSKTASWLMDQLLHDIKASPSADVAPVVHASWEFKRKYGEADECVCSVCGQLLTTRTGERMKYCPNLSLIHI